MKDKMKIKQYLILSVILVASVSAFGQKRKLSNQDLIPDQDIKILHESKKVMSRISNYKGKLLILDFWGTWCAPCIAALPKIDSLQKQFEGELNFLPVTDEPYEKVRVFAENLYKSKKLKLTTIFDDKTIRQMFEYDSIPFYVWIDQNGKIVAQTSFEEITSENIKRAILKDYSKINNRYDVPKLNINVKKPVFTNSISFKDKTESIVLQNIDSSSLEGSSIATSFMPGLPIGKTINDTLRYSSLNLSVKNLYSHLYLFLYYGRMNLGIASKARNVFEFKDTKTIEQLESSTRNSLEYKKFLASYGKCYETIWPKKLVVDDYKKKFKIVKDDLDKYFGIPLGIETFIEKRMVEKCIVLEKTNLGSPLKTKGGLTSEKYDMFSYSIKNASFESFFNRLSGYYFQTSSLPLVDESGIKDFVDMDLNCKMNDISELNIELARYGLKLSIKPAVADVLVFKTR